MPFSLRDAINAIRKEEGQLVRLNAEVDADAEITGIYRHLGAGGTIPRPTREGPALLCSNIKGFPDTQVLIGLLASRKRVGHILGCSHEQLGFLLMNALHNPIAPIYHDKISVPCQQVIRFSTEAGFDIRTILPAPRNTEEDAGPYITMGICYATDPETGEKDATIHRICLQGPDTMTISIAPGRHIGSIYEKYEKMERSMPLSISIGVDPAIPIACGFEAPSTPYGFDELSVAGSLRGEAVELVKCITIDEYAIANAEFVIEAEVLPHERMAEDINTGTGRALPEFTGYIGLSGPKPILKIKAITHQRNPIIQSCIGCSEEHVSMAGLATEASILAMAERAMPGKVTNFYAHSSGCGKYVGVLQYKKSEPSDEGRHIQAGLLALTTFPELKHVFLVDEDVDLFDSNDVLWAMATRYQADIDTITIPGVRFHRLDPSTSPKYNPMLRGKGISCKTIYDCTVPFDMKSDFKRPHFKDVDMTQYQFSPVNETDVI